MGVPKKRTSRQKRDQRRAHWKANRAERRHLPNCGEPVPPTARAPSAGSTAAKQVQPGKED